jgi:hypothetical protein
MDDRQREDLALVHRPQPVEKWWVMLGIGLGVLMYTIDTSIVKIARPTLVQDLRTDFASAVGGIELCTRRHISSLTQSQSRSRLRSLGFAGN